LKALRDIGVGPVGAVERRGEMLEELRAIGEDIDTDQHGLGYTFRAVAADIDRVL